MYINRIEQYRLLEKEFDAKVLSYITSDRPGFETQIAQDVIDIFIAKLDKLGTVHRIVLFLYTRGGDTAAAWNIVNLLRMYCEELWVIVPHKAHSAGTIISLGADKIIMTKQATLGPIDPSLNSPLNPVLPNNPKTTMPVSVEAVKGYIGLAMDEFDIKDDNALASVLIKLSETVHPLVLGQVHRTRAQIKMLAVKLLKNQVADKESVTKIVDFLCSDSGSHDYTINRREAKTTLGLNIEKPTNGQYIIIKKIYDDFCDELGFGQTFNPQQVQGVYAIKRAFIESTYGDSDFFVTEGRTSMINTQNGQPAIKNEKLFEGWRQEILRANQPQKGQVIHENDDTDRI